MRREFNQYIIDESTDDASVIKMLHKDCKPWFKQIKQYTKCFRGYKQKIPLFKKITPRKDRHPKDTPIEIHNMLDDLFKKKFGWYARSEGVFCGGFALATVFGKPHYFFPIGNFKYLYHPNISDLTDHLDSDFEMIHSTSLSKGFQVSDSYSNAEIEKELKSIVNDYEDKKLGIGIARGHEIMVKCKQYYLVNTDFVTDNYREIFKNNLQ